jgi:phosphatidate cytidylyltransferase
VSNFLKRAITGTIFVIVMVGGIWWNYWSLCALFFIISMLGLNEFYGLIEKTGHTPQRIAGNLIAALIFILTALKDKYIYASVFFHTSILLAVFSIIFIVELYRNKETPFTNIGYTILGIVYIVIPFSMWVSYISPYIAGVDEVTSSSTFLKSLADALLPQYNPHVLLGYFFLIWTNDTGAYLSGMALGKHKLWERISPKKTWEGFFGGMLLSIGIGFLISHFYTELSPLVWMLVGLTVSIFGTLGDLVESMFKRSINVKESGGLLPGHGGILDRFDGVLISTPIVLALLQIIEITGALLKG